MAKSYHYYYYYYYYFVFLNFFTRDSIYAIAHICHANSVRLSVCHTCVFKNG